MGLAGGLTFFWTFSYRFSCGVSAVLGVTVGVCFHCRRRLCCHRGLVQSIGVKRFWTTAFEEVSAQNSGRSRSPTQLPTDPPTRSPTRSTAQPMGRQRLYLTLLSTGALPPPLLWTPWAWGEGGGGRPRPPPPTTHGAAATRTPPPTPGGCRNPGPQDAHGLPPLAARPVALKCCRIFGSHVGSRCPAWSHAVSFVVSRGALESRHT